MLQVGYTLVGTLVDNRGLKIYRENLRSRNLARVNPLTASHRRCKVSTTKIKEVIIINHLYYGCIMDVKRMLAVMARRKKA